MSRLHQSIKMTLREEIAKTLWGIKCEIPSANRDEYWVESTESMKDRFREYADAIMALKVNGLTLAELPDEYEARIKELEAEVEKCGDRLIAQHCKDTGAVRT